MQVLSDGVPACTGFAEAASMVIFDNPSFHSVWSLWSVTKARMLTTPLNPNLVWGAGLYTMNEQTRNTSRMQKEGWAVTLLQGGQGCSFSAPEVTSQDKALASGNVSALPSSTHLVGDTINTLAVPTPDLRFAGVSRCFAKQQRLCLSAEKQSLALLLLISAPSAQPLSAVLPFCSLDVPF